MQPRYYEVKPTRRVWIRIFMIFAIAMAVVIFSRSWSAMVIPAIFLALSLLYIRNDRILYNDLEVVIYAPNGRRFHYAWMDIEQVSVTLDRRYARGILRTDLIWQLNIRYCVCTSSGMRSECIKKHYYDYDGAYEFVEFYKTVKRIEEESFTA